MLPSEFTAHYNMDPHKRPEDRTLRLLTVLFWLPAFALLLPHGIISGAICPVLGIVPVTFSAVSGVLHLLDVFSMTTHRTPAILLDVFCAAFLIGILIPGWVFMAEGG